MAAGRRGWIRKFLSCNVKLLREIRVVFSLSIFVAVIVMILNGLGCCPALLEVFFGLSACSLAFIREKM